MINVLVHFPFPLSRERVGTPTSQHLLPALMALDALWLSLPFEGSMIHRVRTEHQALRQGQSGQMLDICWVLT